MRLHNHLLLIIPLGATPGGPIRAAEFDAYGAAPAELAPIQPVSNFVIILGLGAGAAPAYGGASEYKMTFKPIIDVERLHWGWIDIGGDKPSGLHFSPSVSYEGERVSGDHAALNGLDNVDATYALGAQVGYEFVFNDTIRADVYGAARYAFGGAEGLIGEVGVDVTAKLFPQLEIVGGE